MSLRRLGTVLAAIAVALACVAGAQAHQTASNKGVTVTMHVTPDDEPIVGQTSLVLVPRVKTRTGKFAWTTCRCTLTVTNSSLSAVFKGRVQPRTELVFPEAGAYRLDFSGRVRRNGKWVQFKVWFAVRANEAPA